MIKMRGIYLDNSKNAMMENNNRNKVCHAFVSDAADCFCIGSNRLQFMAEGLDFQRHQLIWRIWTKKSIRCCMPHGRAIRVSFYPEQDREDSAMNRRPVYGLLPLNKPGLRSENFFLLLNNLIP